VAKRFELRSFIRSFIPRPIASLRYRLQGALLWRERQYAPPSPDHIKRLVLLRSGIPGAIWVETGTYLGDTTHILSQHSKSVYSIEPEPTLFRNAEKRFKNEPNVKILKGLSEEVFPQLVPTLSGEINFWLDGHNSFGITHKGPLDTPISVELDCIQKHLSRFSKIAVLIDDVHCFNPEIKEFAGYPSLDYLVDWARRNKLAWRIEHDIFIANTVSSPSAGPGLSGK
jgi:hypothetical protein